MPPPSRPCRARRAPRREPLGEGRVRGRTAAELVRLAHVRRVAELQRLPRHPVQRHAGRQARVEAERARASSAAGGSRSTSGTQSRARGPTTTATRGRSCLGACACARGRASTPGRRASAPRSRRARCGRGPTQTHALDTAAELVRQAEGLELRVLVRRRGRPPRHPEPPVQLSAWDAGHEPPMSLHLASPTKIRSWPGSSSGAAVFTRCAVRGGSNGRRAGRRTRRQPLRRLRLAFHATSTSATEHRSSSMPPGGRQRQPAAGSPAALRREGAGHGQAHFEAALAWHRPALAGAARAAPSKRQVARSARPKSRLEAAHRVPRPAEHQAGTHAERGARRANRVVGAAEASRAACSSRSRVGLARGAATR